MGGSYGRFDSVRSRKHMKKYFFIFLFFLLPAGAKAYDGSYLNTFESCTTGTSTEACDLTELGKSAWTNDDYAHISETKAYAGTKSALIDGGIAWSYADFWDGEGEYASSTSYISASGRLLWEDYGSSDGSKDIFSSTGAPIWFVFDLSEHTLDLVSTSSVMLYDDFVDLTIDDWVHFNISVNCETSAYSLSLYTVSKSYEISSYLDTPCYEDNQLNFSFLNYPGDTYLDNLAVDITFSYYDPDAEIIDYPGPFYGNIQVGSVGFAPISLTYCYFSDDTCRIRFDYGFDNIGASVFLLPEYAESLSEAIDSELDLADQYLLSGELTPTIRDSETTDNYWIAVIDADISTSSIYEVTVEWIASTTDDISSTNFIIRYLKQCFPLSIFFQTRDILRNAERNAVDRAEISFNDLIPSEFSGVTVASGTLFSASMLEENLSVWNDYVYPTMQALVYLLFAAIVFIEVYFIFKKSGL